MSESDAPETPVSAKLLAAASDGVTVSVGVVAHEDLSKSRK
jgi:hypothetical protein